MRTKPSPSCGGTLDITMSAQEMRQVESDLSLLPLDPGCHVPYEYYDPESPLTWLAVSLPISFFTWQILLLSGMTPAITKSAGTETVRTENTPHATKYNNNNNNFLWKRMNAFTLGPYCWIHTLGLPTST